LNATELISQLREYANNSGYSHCDYADTMRQAAAALAERATQPAQEQVAAVRAVPEGWKLTRCEDGTIIVSKNNIGGYAAWKDDSNIASSILYHFADEVLAAAPSPQPELSDSICPMKTPAIPDEGANEFIELMADWRHAELGSDSTAAFDALVKFIDAKLAQAREEGRLDGYNKGWADASLTLIKAESRTTAAESRLAEIQRGMEGLRRWRDEELCYGKPEAAMLESGVGEYLKRRDVLALLQPPSQSDTSGLPG
jgi:hypothetical protein